MYQTLWMFLAIVQTVGFFLPFPINRVWNAASTSKLPSDPGTVHRTTRISSRDRAQTFSGPWFNGSLALVLAREVINGIGTQIFTATCALHLIEPALQSQLLCRTGICVTQVPMTSSIHMCLMVPTSRPIFQASLLLLAKFQHV